MSFYNYQVIVYFDIKFNSNWHLLILKHITLPSFKLNDSYKFYTLNRLHEKKERKAKYK